jgi:glycosyltransferase involved in cell wall biosynthesis
LAEAIVIPNPGPVVPSQRRWSLPSCDRSRLLFVGRFDRHKGGDIVIDAFSVVARRFRQLRLWFVGPDRGVTDESDRRWTIRNYIAERAPEVADRIEWLDSQPHSALPDLRRKAFLSIVASRYENFPMAMLEAMSYGCPIVGTRVGGMAEIIQNNINGVLAQPGDPNDLAKVILDLLAKPKFAARIGEQAASSVIRRYHPDTIARKTIAFHQSVLDRTRGRKDTKYSM